MAAATMITLSAITPRCAASDDGKLGERMPDGEQHDGPDRRQPAEDVEERLVVLLLGHFLGEHEQRGEHRAESYRTARP